MKLTKKNLPDFSESFLEFTDQAEADAKWPTSDAAIMQVNPVTHVIDYTQLIDNTNNQIVHDLGAPLNNQTKWTLRWKATQNSRTFSGGTSKIVFWGLSSEDETADTSTVQDMCAFAMNFHDGSPPEVRNVQLQTSFNVTPISFSNFETFVTETSDDPFVFYFELSRDGNVLRGTIYSDPDYSKVIETRSLVIIGNPTGLRFIKFMNRLVVLDTGVAQWSITDVELWDGTHPDEPIENVAEFEDNFEFDKGWISQDVSRLSINTTLKKLEFDSSGTGIRNLAISLDLKTPLPDAGWVMRFKLIVDSPFANGADNTANDLFIGLSNNNGAPNVAQDYLGLRSFASANVLFNKFTLGDVNNGNPSAIPSSSNFGDVWLPGSQAGGSEYFIEFSRLSNDRFRIRVYNDAEFTQLFAERTDVITIGITQLQFIKVMVANFDGSGDSTFTGSIEDIKLYVAKRATKINDFRSRNV